ncbi:MAG: 5-oxoprolinase subunit PxpB [Bacteroidota bacterium]
MNSNDPHFMPLGDSALVIQWGNIIDRSLNEVVVAVADSLKQQPFQGMIDIVPAYSSLTIIYDPVSINSFHGKQIAVFEFIQQYMLQLINKLDNTFKEQTSVIEIPVCYDLALYNDLEMMQLQLKLSVADIIKYHTDNEYYVFMQGFLPGFAYMGEVDKRIVMPRKNKPVQVIAGAVGIAGMQTGIYPVDSPGGWNILGFTPLNMFNATARNPCRLMAGDTVIFKSIQLPQYHSMKENQTAWD